MQIVPDLTDETIAKELGVRLTQIRIHQNLTHKQLAEKAGISIRTITRIEKGEIPQFSSFIRICRALGLLPGIEMLVPAVEASPLLLAKLQPKLRKRARNLKPSNRTINTPQNHTPHNWKWADEKPETNTPN